METNVKPLAENESKPYKLIVGEKYYHPLPGAETTTLLPPTADTNNVLTPDKPSVRVFGDRVLIRPDAVLEHYKESTIVIPEVSLEKPLTGTIVAVGKKVEEAAVGDKIHFGKFSGHEIELELDGVKELLILCREDDILLAVNG